MKTTTIEDCNLILKHVKDTFYKHKRWFLRLDGINGDLRFSRGVCDALLGTEIDLFFIVYPERCKTEEKRIIAESNRKTCLQAGINEEDLIDWVAKGVSLKDFEKIIFLLKTPNAIRLRELYQEFGRRDFFKNLFKDLIDPIVFDLPGFLNLPTPTKKLVIEKEEAFTNVPKVKSVKLFKHYRPAYDILPRHCKEYAISLRLQAELGGLREVPTPSGNIDLLTADKLIELKVGEDWKAGIGQLIAYGYHIPDRHKVLWLFDYENVDLADVRAVCASVGIEVMLEP